MGQDRRSLRMDTGCRIRSQNRINEGLDQTGSDRAFLFLGRWRKPAYNGLDVGKDNTIIFNWITRI